MAWADRWRSAIFATLAALMLAVWNGHWRLGPDAARTAWVARRVERGLGWSDDMGWHETLSVGVVLLYAGAMKIFELNWPAVVQAVIWLFGAFTLALVYQTFKRVVARGEAVIVTALTGLTWTFLAGAVRPLSDMIFLAGVMLVWLGIELLRQPQSQKGDGLAAPPATRYARWRLVIRALIVLGYGLALAAVMRSVWVVLAAAVGVGLLVELRRAGRWRLMLALGLGWAAVVVGVRQIMLGSWRGLSDDEKVLLEALPRLSEKIGPNARQLLEESAAEGLFAMDLGFVAWVVSVAVLVYGVVVPWRRRPMWSCYVVLLIVQWLLFLPTDRYLLAALPILVWSWWRAAVVVEGWMTVWWQRRMAAKQPVDDPEKIVEREALGRRVGGLVLAGALTLLLVCNAVEVVKLTIEQRMPGFGERYNRGRYAAMRELARTMRDTLEPDALVFAGRDNPHEELAFWSEVRVVDDLPQNVPPASAYYLLEPPDEHLRDAMESFGWKAGRIVTTANRPDHQERWRLRVLERVEIEESTEDNDD